MLLSPEGAALREASFPSGWLTEDGGTSRADNHGLSVAEHGRDLWNGGGIEKETLDLLI